MNYGFIGFGNLAKAIHQGLKNDKKLNFGYISKTSKHKGIKNFDSLQKLVLFADVIFLCVKPKDAESILKQLKNINMKNKILVSPVAGKTIKFIERYTSKNAAIIRIMPNLAIAHRKSVTAYCYNNFIFNNNDSLKLADKVEKGLSELGTTVKLQESKFDLFTAIFGSGPAFLLEIMKVLQKKTNQLKLSGAHADDSLIALLEGTALYFKNNKSKSLNQLVKAITSKGGTTEAGLKYYKNKNLDRSLGNMIEIARKKSKQLN